MDDRQISLVQQSYAKVLLMAELVERLFYEDLFETAPEIRPLFSTFDLEGEGRRLMVSMAALIDGLSTPERIIPSAEALAIRHLDYGTEPEHYDAMGASLIRALGKGLGDAFTPELEEAWRAFYDLLADAMKKAAYG